MKSSILILFSLLPSLLGAEVKVQPIDQSLRDRIVEAIYKAEGGNKTRYPFGIKSIDTKGDVEKARKICSNTVQNNYLRWQRAGKTNDFISFLGERFCPVSDKSDTQGLNKNWIRNVKSLLKE